MADFVPEFSAPPEEQSSAPSHLQGHPQPPAEEAVLVQFSSI